MKTLLFPIFMFLAVIAMQAQTVRNVNFTINANDINITYDLLDTDKSGQYNIELYYSLDKGIVWQGPLNKDVSGDIGSNIDAGTNKKIIWKPLLSMPWFFSNYVMFKVVVISGGSNFTETAAGLNLDMVFVKGGTFTMGSPTSEVDRSSNETQHQVTLSDYYIGKYEITFEQYDAFCTATSREKPSDSGWGRGKRPIINVSWNDATAYCEWLSKQTGKTYRLPTEAEWEYAARAATSTPFSTGNNLTTSQANYDGNYPYNNNAKGEYRQKTLPVGSFAANAYGLYDMHGNVWEWCSDWYGDYSTSVQTNPKGATTGSRRVIRGGCWSNLAQYCRTALRDSFTPDSRYYYIGFRLVVSP